MAAYDPAPRAPFRLGLNYPWKGYGWDFSPTPFGDGLVRREADAIRRSLDVLAGSGISLLRWFVASDGRNLPSPGADVYRIARVRTYEGLGAYLERSTSDSAFNEALMPQEDFLGDLVTLSGWVFERGMRLMPTFLSSTFLTPSRPELVRDEYVAGGRIAFVFGNESLPRKRLLGGFRCGTDDDEDAIGRSRPYVSAFLEHTLAPMVAAIPKAHVFAWDVMNEPEWCIRDTPYTKGHSSAILHPWMALTYLNAALRVVAREGRDVSIGFVDGRVDAWYPRTRKRDSFAAFLDATLAGFPDVTYFHQHHHYPRFTGDPDDPASTTKSLPDVAEFALPGRPVLLGEYQMRFAAGLTRGAEAALRRKVAPWPDADGEHDDACYLEKRLALAQARGYAGALGWAGPGDPDNGQSPYADGEQAVSRALAQLARFALSC